MSKSVHFSDEPFLVRQISDQSKARKQNSQTPNELRLAMNSYYTEETEKINEQQERKKKYKKIPISTRVEDAVTKGTMESSHIRSENIAQEHRYDNWWLGGNKTKNKTKNKIKNKIKSKKMKTMKRKQ
jgi:hypothetical protein